MKYLNMRGESCVGINAEWLFYYTNIDTGEVKVEGPFLNKITQQGLVNFAKLIAGEVSSQTAAMHCVLGSNASAASINDTILTMGEVARGLVSDKSTIGNEARIRTFFDAGSVSGDFACAGLVARSTNLPESGELINRVVKPISKTERTALTVEVRFKIEGG